MGPLLYCRGTKRGVQRASTDASHPADGTDPLWCSHAVRSVADGSKEVALLHAAVDQLCQASRHNAEKTRHN